MRPLHLVLLFLSSFALTAAVLVQPLSLPGTAFAQGNEPPLTDGFDFPVGAPHGRGYVDAQPFGRNHHLGSDWNAQTGGDSDLGDPVYSVAHGHVAYAGDLRGGWGNVVRVVHRTPTGEVESVYAHLDRIDVKVGETVRRGQAVGTIGDAHGVYVSHLHFEIRDQVGMDIGPGYATNTEGWVDPTQYIEAHRPVR